MPPSPAPGPGPDAGAQPPDLLRAALRGDPARPLLTWYDEGSGERVELSVATFDNWVAKTAGLARDGLAAGPGDTVALLVPPHWQALVWAAACWSAGCAVGLGPGPARVAVCGPDTAGDAAATGAADVVALSLRPMGLPFAGPLPPGALDYAVEVPAFPDRFSPWAAAGPADPAVRAGGAAHTRAGLVGLARDRAGQLGLSPRARVLRPARELDLAFLVDALLVPLLVDGSAVVVVGGAGNGPADRHEDRHEDRLARIAATERVTDVVPA